MPILLGVIGMALSAYIVGFLLAGSDWNPTLILKFPGESPGLMAYAEGLFGSGNVVPAEAQGHDGKFYFIQAMDPFYLDPDQHARLLDRPTYRAQRMLYPTLAGGFGVVGPWATAWGLVILNVVGVGVGTFLTARLAQEVGISVWFGLGFVLNPGVLVSSFISTAEVLAMVLFVAAARSIYRRNHVSAAVLLSLAALTRETMLLAAAGAAVYTWRTGGKVIRVYALPVIASVAWWLYLLYALGHLHGALQDTAAIGPPFKGFIEAFRMWTRVPGMEVDLLMAVVLILAVLMIVIRSVRKPNLLGYMATGFALIAVLMSEPVWQRYFDSARALAPIITVYVLMTPMTGRAIDSELVDQPSKAAVDALPAPDHERDGESRMPDQGG